MPGSAQAIKHLEAFSQAIIEAATGLVPAIKLQVAFFEQHGPDGLRLLSSLAIAAKQRELLVIMDAKRGDIGTTAQAYAEAWLGPDSIFAADALTLNPYMGFDSLKPFVRQARQTRSGVFILVRTSNPGSADLQQLMIDGKPTWAHVAAGLVEMVKEHTDPTCNLSSVGIVVGATGPKDALAVRDLLPTAPFLIPGYGAQGAKSEEALSGLTVDKQEGVYKGGLVNASRSITHGKGVQNASTLGDAVAAMKTAIQKAIFDLAVNRI